MTAPPTTPSSTTPPSTSPSSTTPSSNPVARAFTHLRHVDLAVPDYDRQVQFYEQTWGLVPEHSDTDATFFAGAGSAEPFDVRVRRGDKRLDLIAWGAASRADVDALAERLGRDGEQLVSQPADLDTPGGGYGFRFFDPDGRTIEVSSDVAARAATPLDEGDTRPVKLSHVVVNTPRAEATVDWYINTLGFSLSDTLWSPHMGTIMWFLRTNTWHHSLAIAKGPHPSIHHTSYELRGLDEWMGASGRALQAGTERVWGPGRHLAGNNTFHYFLDPHGNTVEYTTELELVDDANWEPRQNDFSQPHVADQWGTANPMGPEVAAKSFNEPDPGVFNAPPL